MTDRLEWLAAQLKELSAQTHGDRAMEILIQEYRAETSTPARLFRLTLVGKELSVSKIHLIKHTRTLTGATLKDARDWVDCLPVRDWIELRPSPVQLLEGSQEKCQEAKALIESAGGICTLEPV